MRLVDVHVDVDICVQAHAPIHLVMHCVDLTVTLKQCDGCSCRN